MALHSTLLCILLSVALVSGSGPVPKYTTKVLDFSADNDQNWDNNGDFTSATLNARALPESFTICSAFMVDAWTTEFTSADMITLLDDDGYKYGGIEMYAEKTYTEYYAYLGPAGIQGDPKRL